MSDRLPGSSSSNPIEYRGKWRICISAYSLHPQFDWEYWHDDYDGAEDANDHRYGYAASEQGCKDAIDEWIEENEHE